MIVPFHAASSQRSLWQGALMSTLRTSFPCPLLPPPVVCTLLPIGSFPAFQCCTQTDQLGIQHLNPRPYLWQPQIEHLYPSSTTKTLWSLWSCWWSPLTVLVAMWLKQSDDSCCQATPEPSLFAVAMLAQWPGSKEVVQMERKMC